ncbi:MAG TPA: hypothetical protein VIR30_02395 [Nocardioides sp.]
MIPSSSPGRTLETLLAERSKLLRLHYGDQISADLFTEEERRLTRLIEAHRAEANADPLPTEESQDQLVEAFDQIAGPLADLNIEPVWTSATEQERRTLLDELLDRVAVFPDHLEVQVHGAPRLNLALAEVRLASREQIGGVGGGT